MIKGVSSFKFQVSSFKFQVSSFMFQVSKIMMEKAYRFEDLHIFQHARELCKEVYAITSLEPWKSDYRFVQQIHASAGSVMDNIAEGYERDGNAEFINFLYIAKGSCGEVRSQLIRAHDVGFLSDEKYNTLYNSSINLSKEIAAFIKSLRSSGIKGQKYLKPETS